MSGLAKSPRGPLIVMTAACLLFAGVYAALWSAGASAMRKTVAAIAKGSDETDVAIDSLRTKGFPFFLRGELRSVTVRRGALSWRSPELAIDALPVNPNRFIFTSVDPQTVDLGRWGAYEVRADGGRASLERRKGVFIANAQADRIDARPTRGAVAVSANGILFKAAPAEEKSGDLHASLFAGAFEIAREGRTAKGEKLLFDVIARGGPEKPTADIKRLTIEARGASVELTGALALDAGGYPEGALDAVLRNPKGLAVFLAELGALSDEEARAAGAALRLAAFATGGEIRAPIELKDGAARIVGVKIAALPKMR